MTRTHLCRLLLGLGLFTASACGSPEATADAINKTIDTATDNVRDVAGDTVHALDSAADELGGYVEDAAEEVGKAVDNVGRKQSNAK